MVHVVVPDAVTVAVAICHVLPLQNRLSLERWMIARTLAAPALTEWFGARCAADPFLREQGLVLLGEVASVSVAHSAFEAIAGVPYQHTEMLGAIWRESVDGYLRTGERAIRRQSIRLQRKRGRLGGIGQPCGQRLEVGQGWQSEQVPRGLDRDRSGFAPQGNERELRAR